MNFTQLYKGFLLEEEIRDPILRSLNLYDRSDRMDQTSACLF